MSSTSRKRSSKRPQSSKVQSKNLFQGPKIGISNMKKDSGSFLQRDVTNPNQPSSQFPSIDKINRSKSIMNESSELKLESYNEEYTIIQKMWRDLGVTNKYQVLFNNYIKSVTEAKLKNIFINERHTLKKFGESILKLSKEISARENNIRSLKKYVFSLINGTNYFEDENEKLKKHKDNLISSIISLIKSLRLNSVNVIMHFSKVRELSTYYTLVGKIEIPVTEGFRRFGIVSTTADEVANLLLNNLKIGVSSRGVGSVEQRYGKYMVGDDYELICWDVVSDPSTPNAWISTNKEELQQYVESKAPEKNTLLEKLEKFNDWLIK